MIKGKIYYFKFAVGLLISILFLYFALRKVDIQRTMGGFKMVNYWFLIPAIAILFISHFIRTLRWRYLLDPIGRFRIQTLFSSLMIGYGINTLMPAHLGELPRAYLVSKKGNFPFTQIFATIVTERIIDIFSLFILMLLVLYVYRFPEWVTKSGYIIFGGSVATLALLLFLKYFTDSTLKMISYVLRSSKNVICLTVERSVLNFLSGIKPMKRSHDYMIVGVLSAVIWFCNCIVFLFCLRAFNFSETEGLNWAVSMILLVITSIAIVIPSSPGYVGTYHYLCQISLNLFGISADHALTFATVLHGVNFIPVLIVGLIYAQRESLNLFALKGNNF